MYEKFVKNKMYSFFFVYEDNLIHNYAANKSFFNYLQVMESYRMMSAARSKGKKLNKKELSQIRGVLEERDTLSRNTRIDS